MSHDNAPAVAYPVGRTPALAWWLAGLWLAGVAAVGWALFSAPALAHRWLAALLAVASILVCAGACLAFWRGQRARTLLWDGERWSLEPDSGGGQGEEARLHARMDLQRVMLLSLSPPHGRRQTWLWAVAAHDPARWHLLRCALYFSTRSSEGESPVAGQAGKSP